MIVGPYHPGPWNPPPLKWHSIETIKTKYTEISHENASVRARRVLRMLGVNQVKDLWRVTRRDLHNFKNCGNITKHEIERLMNLYGFVLE